MLNVFIRFRCPACEHKVRVQSCSGEKQGKCKCKCGAVITVPLSRWQIAQEPRSHWLEAPIQEPALNAARPSSQPARSTRTRTLTSANKGFRQGLVVGSSSVLAVSMLVVACFFGSSTSRSNGSETEQEIQPAKVELKAPAKVEPKTPAKVEPKLPVKVEPKLPAKTEPKTPAKVAPKPAAKLNKMEIIGWTTAAKVAVVGAEGKKEVLLLNGPDLKAGAIFVVVKVRMPARMLAGRSLNLPNADVKLLTPGKEPLLAIGCTMRDGQFFAPDQGKYAYETQGEAATQTWLFEGNVSDLESGYVRFQFGGQPAESLTLKLRVKAL